MKLAKNLNYLKAYYKSTIDKILISNNNININSLIDCLVDDKEFEIQLYIPKDRISISTNVSECSRCHKTTSINSTFCPNCCMKKLLFERNDIESMMNQDNSNQSYIILDNIYIHKKNYETIIWYNIKELKKRLKEEYIK